MTFDVDLGIDLPPLFETSADWPLSPMRPQLLASDEAGLLETFFILTCFGASLTLSPSESFDLCSVLTKPSIFL